MNRSAVATQPTAPAGQRCVCCHAPAEITEEIKQLPCGHHATRINGVVVGWADTGAMTLNLARSAMCSDRQAARFEEHTAGILRRRDETTQRLTAGD